MKATLLSIVLVSLSLNVDAAEKAAPKDGDLGLLQGRWTAMAGARRQVRVVLEVKGQAVSVAITTPQGLEFTAEGELKLDEKTTPRSLNWYNFIGPGEQPLPEIAAVYIVEGDTFTVCNGGFHGARPKEFKPGESALADLVVFHRVGAKESDSLVHSQEGSPPQSPSVSDSNQAGGVSTVRPSVAAANDRSQATLPARSTTASSAPLPMTTLNQTQYPASRTLRRRPIRSTISALLGNRRNRARITASRINSPG
jgi:uncharacterized protein (TIGR03067 family)